MANYMPTNDAELALWLYNLVTGLNTHLEDLGLDAADILPLQTGYTAYSGDVTVLATKRTAVTAATNARNASKLAVEGIVRPLVQRIQHVPGMTDELRGELGLPVRSPRTTHSIGPETPGIFAETAPGKVTVHFGTSPQNERLNAKPAWAKGCNIYRKRSGDTEWAMLAFQGASPYIDRVSGSGTDYTYMVRYRGTQADEIGDESVTVTVAARGEMAA
jgi:hypothetical protein